MLRPAAAPLGAEHRLLLALTPIAARRDADAIGRLADACDPAAFVALCERHGVLALYGARLGTRAPAAVAEAAERDRVGNAARAIVFEAALEEVLGRLRTGRIPALAIKGPALARAAHDDPGLRRCGDLDVLVAAGDLEHAAGLLRGAGYVSRPEALDRAGRPALHLTLDPAGGGPTVELHWRVHWADAGHGAALVAMGPQAQLVVLLLCYARDGFAGVRLAADLAGWWDRHGDAPGAAGLRPFATAHPRLAPVLATAAAVAQDVAGIPAAAVLDSPPHRRAAALADPLALGDPQALRGGRLAVELLLGGPRGCGAFVRRQARAARALPRRRDRWLHAPRTAARVGAALLRGSRRA